MINTFQIPTEQYTNYDLFVMRLAEGKHEPAFRTLNIRGRYGRTESTVFAEFHLSGNKNAVPITLYKNEDGTRELIVFTNWDDTLARLISEVQKSGLELNVKDAKVGEEVISMAG